MAKGYWIGHMDISDPEAYDRYRAANAEPFAKFGAKFLVRGGEQQIREGSTRARSVVIEFESYEQAIACYDSPEYQAAKAMREGASIGDLVIIAGYEQ